MLNNGARGNDVSTDYVYSIVSAGQYRLFQLLFDAGLDPKRDVLGETMMSCALRYNRFEIVDLLIEKSYRIDENDIFKFAKAYPNGFLRYIKRGHTIDPLIEDDYGVPLLFSIVESGSIELLDYISTNMNIDWNQTSNPVILLFS